jgi:nucleoside-diphosphate-sugar epimerase
MSETKTGRTRSLVTGGAGFVGRHLVTALLDRGDDVVVVDMAHESPDPRVTYHRADISDADAVRGLCDNIDVVYHNASVVHTRNNKVDYVWSVNLGGTEHFLEDAQRAGVRKFVYVGSASAVYEGKDIHNGDESLPYSSVSQAPYADSKIAAEKRVLEHDGVGGMNTCAIRPHIIFGPYDNRLLPTILARAKAGKLKLAVGRGDWLSDFTYVGNLVDALLLAEGQLGENGRANGEAYFVTNGEPTQFFDFVGQVLAQMDLPPIKGFVPYWLAYSVAAVKETLETLRGGDLQADQGVSRFAIRYLCTHHYFNIEKARDHLGYAPRVDIAEGIKLTVAHLQAQPR